jgi:hypothetical protein
MMKTRVLPAILVACCLLLPACEAAPEAASASSGSSTDIPIQAVLPVPTYTPIPEDTSMPSPIPPTIDPASLGLIPVTGGMLFREDFTGMLRPGWLWENQNPGLLAFTEDGWLQVTGEYSSLWEDGYQSNLLWYPLPQGSFAVTVHTRARPTQNFQQAALFLYEDSGNYVSIERGYCDLCPTIGSGVYMHSIIGGNRNNYDVKEAAEDVYLRLESTGSTMTGSYAVEPDKWTVLGRFGYSYPFRRVGIGVSNVHASEPLTAYFDSFELFVP